MATPIGDTPILYGEDATNFLNSLCTPLSENEKKNVKRNEGTKICSFLNSPDWQK